MDNNQHQGRRPVIPQSSDQNNQAESATKKRNKRRSDGARSQVVIFFNFLMAMVFFGVLAAVGGLYFANEVYERDGPHNAAQSFVVPEGAGLISISQSLERAGLITDNRVFRHMSEFILNGDTLKAGEYEIEAGMSMRAIMEKLQSGKSILYAFTAPEGLTVYQIFERLKADEDLTGDLPDELPAEGSLLPNTYNFARGATRADIVEQMRQAQLRAVDRLWERRIDGLPIKTKEEMVILASIVEKETGKADERAHVAGVFVNRLNIGMRLQSDPTIIYGIFGGEGKPSGRPIYRSDLDKKTDYNTYQIDGLPPTPIANPGLQAMEAVINPLETKDLFFVADGTGGHAFAETLAQHNANVAEWRKVEAAQKIAAEAAAAEAAKAAAQEGTQNN